MKNKETLEQEVVVGLPPDVVGLYEIQSVSAVFRQFKRFIIVAAFAGTGFLMNGCAAGYVATEPVYVENVRPPRPTELHVWVDGGWKWNRHNHAYAHTNGYWSRQNNGRVYVTGHWQSSSRGQSWTPGHWQKNN